MPRKQKGKQSTSNKGNGEGSSGSSKHGSDDDYAAKKPRVPRYTPKSGKPVKPPLIRTPVSPPSPTNPPVGSGAAGGAAPGSAASNAPAPAEARVDKGKSPADRKCSSKKCNRSTVDGNEFCCVECWNYNNVTLERTGNNQHTHECDLNTALQTSLGMQVEEAAAGPKKRVKFEMPDENLEKEANFISIQCDLIPPCLQTYFERQKGVFSFEFLRCVKAAPKRQLNVLNEIAEKTGFLHGTSLASVASMTKINVDRVKAGTPLDGGMTKQWGSRIRNGTMFGGGIYITDSFPMAQNYTSRGSRSPHLSDMCFCFMKVTTRMTQENTLLIADSIHENRTWRESFNKMLLEQGKEIRFVMLVSNEYWNARRMNTSQGISKASQIVVRYPEDIQGILQIIPCNLQAQYEGGTCHSEYRIVGKTDMLKVVISHNEWRKLTEDQQEKLSKIAPEASLDSLPQSANGGSAASK